jgi:hypothetical protein
MSLLNLVVFVGLFFVGGFRGSRGLVRVYKSRGYKSRGYKSRGFKFRGYKSRGLIKTA